MLGAQKGIHTGKHEKQKRRVDTEVTVCQLGLQLQFSDTGSEETRRHRNNFNKTDFINPITGNTGSVGNTVHIE